ncbi:dihydrofolate reductase family protein [Mucilaginibacter sp. ZT4R22]|uniref:Dihydrofolate reductase family protein n=1 Tax=Mucilaginibacter pankratovii TaxID=2772110 RepID=A0ABR7WUC3_9SPHI|nr:dihydrofolate reductase family protein [Mucilaginibacter pankratovii]MBD1364847.1 dihydrofolate reductase family protein [Mucilaginibacter pankratovii]
MRKIKFQMQVTLDGYVAGPEGEMDWMTWNWDEELKEYVGAITEPVDLIILGRVLAEGFIPYWTGALGEGEEGADKMVNTHKVVFTKTLTENPWANTTLATGDIAEEISKLKSQPGGDIMVYGGARLASAMIKNNLIDEYHIFVNPVVIGSGMTIYNDLQDRLNLKLVETRSFPCGINVLVYNPVEK